MRCNTIEIYFDASVLHDAQSTSIGYTVKHPDGATLLEESLQLPSHKPSTQAEYLALIHAVGHALREVEASSVEVYGDAHSVLSVIDESTSCSTDDPELQHYVRQARKLLSHFTTYTLTYIDNALNEDAHNLARQAHRHLIHPLPEHSVEKNTSD